MNLRRPVFERLEGRDVPSAIAAVQPAHVELLDGEQGVSQVGSPIASLQDDSVTSTHSTVGSLDERDHTAKPGDGNDPTPAPANNADGGGETRRPVSQTAATRNLVDSLYPVTRRTDRTSDFLPSDPPAIGQETVPALNEGDASDSAGESSLVAWAPSSAMPVIMSLATLPGLFAGFDGRAWPSASESRESSPVGHTVAELEVREPAPGDAQTAPGSSVAVPALDRDAPTWGHLVDGAIHADWEVVDAELRQFLSGLSELAQHPEEYGAGQTWPLWIGMAGALLLARRSSSIRQRLFGRPVRGPFWVAPGGPIPVGPWPLGSP